MKPKLLPQTIGLMLVVLLLVGCGGASTAPAAAPITVEYYGVSEPITFLIDDTIAVCTDQLPYSIIQITEGGKRTVMLEHSCIGIAGSGIDRYCEDGEIKTAMVKTCSDAIFCEEQAVHETVTWDQQEYVDISEECAGETIHREIEQQVPEGKYQVIVGYMQNDQVIRRVIKEFIITSNEPSP